MLKEGVPLVGDEPESGLFSKRPKPKLIDEHELQEQASFRRSVLMLILIQWQEVCWGQRPGPRGTKGQQAKGSSFLNFITTLAIVEIWQFAT